MRKVFATLLMLAALAAVVLPLPFSGARADDAIQASIEVRPNTLTGTGTVDVSINIANISDDPSPLSITLYDPAGNVCAGFGSGGTAHLTPGQSMPYTGKWTVTAEQLEKGRISYNARYQSTTATGERVATSKPFFATIKHNAARASLNIDRSTPSGSVTENQTVTIKYTITNTGTIDILDIAIKDPGINNDVLTWPHLPVGEKIELSTSYVAGTSSKTTNATISYKYVVGDKTESKEVTSEPKVINVTVPDLVVDLKASTLIVNAGQKVDLTCVITNRSDLDYEQLKVTDKTLNDVEPGVFSLNATKKSHTIVKSITVMQSSTYQFTVSGFDNTGQAVQVSSNEVTVQTTEDALGIDALSSDVIPVVLDIVIEADRDIIYAEPSEIIFRVKVTNNGLLTAESVIVSAGRDRKTIHTIEKIEPGETVEFLKRLAASMGGQYQFEASAKNNQGETERSASNIFPVVFQPTRPPVTPPPATLPPPPQTQPDPTEEPAAQPDDSGIATGKLLLYILAGLLVVIVLAVVLLFVLDSRRGKPKPPSDRGRGGSGGGKGGQNVVIDSIQRSTHRDYARAPKRGKPSKSAKKPHEQPTVPAYAPDDEEMFYRDAEDKKPVSTHNYGMEDDGMGFDDDAAYRRPTEPEIKSMHVPPITGDSGAEEDILKKNTSQGDFEALSGEKLISMEKTEIYGNDYLARIRQGGAEKSEGEDGDEGKPALSEEDAALLSGSTGQYRLSRRVGSVSAVGRSGEPAEKTAASRKVEDPEEYTRKQRAARGAQSIANFYDDDDDDNDDTARPSRKQRK